MSADTLVRLADYKPPVWSVDAVELRFELFSTETLVHARLSIQRLANAAPERLCWPAVAMEIQALAINGSALASERHFSATSPKIAREMFEFACKKDDVPVDEVDLSVWNRWANRWDEVSQEDSSEIH